MHLEEIETVAATALQLRPVDCPWVDAQIKRMGRVKGIGEGGNGQKGWVGEGSNVVSAPSRKNRTQDVYRGAG